MAAGNRITDLRARAGAQRHLAHNHERSWRVTGVPACRNLLRVCLCRLSCVDARTRSESNVCERSASAARERRAAGEAPAAA